MGPKMSIEPSSRAQQEQFLAVVRGSLDDGGDCASAVRELLDWSDRAGLRQEFALKSRGWQCLIKLHLPPDDITLLHIEANGVFTWLGMAWLRNHRPFEQVGVQGALQAMIEELPVGCYFFHAAGIRGPTEVRSIGACRDRQCVGTRTDLGLDGRTVADPQSRIVPHPMESPVKILFQSGV